METENITMWKAVGKMWQRCFDSKGTCSKREFWLAFGFHAILAVAGILVAGISFLASKLTNILNEFQGVSLVILVIFLVLTAVITLYLIIAQVPLFFLACRRLNDCGRSKLWLLLLLFVGLGTIIFLVLLCGSGAMFWNSSNGTTGGQENGFFGFFSRFDPNNNIQPDVYGPPETETFFPETNEEVCVYGPPEIWEESAVEIPVSTIVESTEEYETQINEETAAYETSEIYTEEFLPESNIEVDVYGPPEMMFSSESEILESETSEERLPEDEKR